MTSSNDPDAIRAEIEQTRGSLSYDVDALNEKVNPSRVMDRRVGEAKGKVTGLKDKVFGSDSPSSTSSGGVGDAANSAKDSLQQTPDAVKGKTQGNPLAAGLIAFGVGWLVSSLLPTSEKEKELAGQAETLVKDHSQPLVDQAKHAAQEAGDALKPAAQDAAQSVKDTAQGAAQNVKDEGQSAKDDVQGQAQQSKQNVQDNSKS